MIEVISGLYEDIIFKIETKIKTLEIGERVEEGLSARFAWVSSSEPDVGLDHLNFKAQIS